MNHTDSVMCSAALIKQYRERARACGVTLDSSNYREVLDECEWPSYEMAIQILAQNSRMKTSIKSRIR